MPKFRRLPKYVIERRTGAGIRYYWQPSKAMREQGCLAARLSDNRADAIREGEIKNAEYDTRRWGVKDDGPRPGSISFVVAHFLKSGKFTERAPATRKDYQKHADGIREDLGPVEAAAITRAHVLAYRDKMMPKLGSRQGKYRMQVMRLVMGHAVDLGLITQNPANRPGIRKSRDEKKRTTVWEADDILDFMAVAEPEMKLALVVGHETGQRIQDCLNMDFEHIDASGSIKVIQGKTGATVHPRVTRLLRAALDETGRTSGPILVGPSGKRWSYHRFNRIFSQTKAKAGLQDHWFMDLRRTCVVRLAEAGNDVARIASITGHSVEDAARILDTYLPPTKRIAGEAIDLLEAYRDRQDSDTSENDSGKGL